MLLSLVALEKLSHLGLIKCKIIIIQRLWGKDLNDNTCKILRISSLHLCLKVPGECFEILTQIGVT